ncbi:hypothetical protein JW933_09700 [candidate division FCPU426 bacterium]|nr:hypothetical protein [candidate division FCPU426 bacterium]
MKQMICRAVAVLVFILLNWQPVIALDEVTFKALVEKDKIKFGEKIQYLIIVNFGTNTMPPAITPPSFLQFNVLAENERVQEVGEGAERYKIMKKIWLLEPAETGRLSIASGIITYQDPTSNLLKNGKTDVVFVEVEPTTESEVAKQKKTAAADKGNTLNAQGRGLPVALILFAVVAGLGGTAVWLLGSRKPAPPQINHENKALLALNEAIAFAEADDLDKYYAGISRTLLDYLQEKFGVDAHVLSTVVLLEKLTAMKIPKSNLEGLEEFFKVADKAKFAGFVPDEDKMIELHGIVKDFIEAGRKIKIKPPKVQKQREDEDEA